MKKFNYVIARKSANEEGQLTPFHFYNTAVFFGDLDDAKKTLKYVQSVETNLAGEFQIYKVDNKLVN